MNLKYYKEQVNVEDYIIVSFFPSKVTLKPQSSDCQSQITHNLNFQELYEIIGLTCQYDILNYILSKVKIIGDNKQTNQNDDEDNDQAKRKPIYLNKIDLQLPKLQYDPKDYVVINQENEQNGLFRQNIGHVNLDEKKYLVTISPPTFEVNYSSENRREIQQVTVQKLNDIVKRGFNFSFKVVN